MEEKAKEKLPRVKLLEKGTNDPALVRKLAQYKRLVEIWSLDADFQAAYRLDPGKAVADTGLEVDAEEFSLLINGEKEEQLFRDIREGKRSLAELPESFLLFKAFLGEKLAMREKMRAELCVPDEPRFRAWRDRQEKRCRIELGPSSRSMVQAPLMFELSEGCSVGCPFCGIASEGLRGIFRYTEENAALWREVLRCMHRLIGDAAGSGTCYYSCEGLDNPDYEKFLEDFYQEFGLVPQTTTAASTRNIERTRALLNLRKEESPHIDRFSVLSADMRDELFASFTPEELLMVELLPQFPEAPSNVFTKAGRNRDPADEDAVGGTIACASGFVVNMHAKTLRLMTPFVSDRRHPTGEWILEKTTFSSAADLEAQARRMIAAYMPEELDLERTLGASCDFRMQQKDGWVWVYGHGLGLALLHAPLEQTFLDALLSALKERCRRGYEILELLPGETGLAECILLLRCLWNHGLIDQITE